MRAWGKEGELLTKDDVERGRDRGGGCIDWSYAPGEGRRWMVKEEVDGGRGGWDGVLSGAG